MKNKLLLITSFLLVLMLLLEFKKTYGLFESDYDLNVTQSIGKWNIYVNNVDARTEETIDIDTFVNNENSRVKEGRIAPSSSGYFDISINPLDTNVAFMYNLSFNFTNLNENIVIDRIEETLGNTIIRTDENTYSNIFTLEDIENNLENNIRVHIKWINDETMNEEDSEIGLLKDNSLGISVNVVITQYLGEQLVPYDDMV